MHTRAFQYPDVFHRLNTENHESENPAFSTSKRHRHGREARGCAPEKNAYTVYCVTRTLGPYPQVARMLARRVQLLERTPKLLNSVKLRAGRPQLIEELRAALHLRQRLSSPAAANGER